MLLRTRRSGFIEPCLPSPAERPPSGPGWFHEIKLDGFRLMARRDAAGVRLLTRNGLDWSTSARSSLLCPLSPAEVE
jgi:bifunctional non-homologous end joining protein LigD